MKTRFYWLALLGSAALIAQADAAGRGGGGGGRGGGFGGRGFAARGGGGFHSAPGRSFGGGRMTYCGQRFSSGGYRSYSGARFRQHYGNANISRANSPRQFAGVSMNRGNGRAFTRGGSQIQSGRNLAGNWRNHVVARRGGNWHRDWDRGRDHRWNGRHWRYYDGSWLAFDSGFYPFIGYGYPYGYGYADYPYSDNYYDTGDYDSEGYPGGEYDDDSDYGGPANQSNDSIVAAAQERLARQGYYRGKVDGSQGPQTRHAVAGYQRSNGLRATGHLTSETIRALGLTRVASD